MNLKEIFASKFHMECTIREVKKLINKVKSLRDEMTELILLYDAPLNKDSYKMSSDEYMRLDGNVRL